jgi:hypothetical protein
MRVDAWVCVGTAGTVLFVAVVATKLSRASYAQDVATLCDAESASGFSVSQNAARLTAWTQERLQTPEGNRLLASLRDLPPAERGPWLESRSRAAGLANCPMVPTYAALAQAWSSEEELQILCSTVTFPDLERLDEPTRLQVIDEWFALHASTPEVRGLGSRLQSAHDAGSGAALLQEAASDLGILTCDVAKVLSRPFVQSCGP